MCDDDIDNNNGLEDNNNDLDNKNDFDSNDLSVNDEANDLVDKDLDNNFEII